MPQKTARTVAVSVLVDGEQRLLRGRGTYEDDADLGSVLRIALTSTAGCEELLLAEETLSAMAEPGTAWGCDLLIRLN